MLTIQITHFLVSHIQKFDNRDSCVLVNRSDLLSGKVVSGWRVKNRSEWDLIGKQDPQLPQMFYPVEKEMEIKQGDTVAARCTMVNNRDRYILKILASQ